MLRPCLTLVFEAPGVKRCLHRPQPPGCPWARPRAAPCGASPQRTRWTRRSPPLPPASPEMAAAWTWEVGSRGASYLAPHFGAGLAALLAWRWSPRLPIWLWKKDACCRYGCLTVVCVDAAGIGTPPKATFGDAASLDRVASGLARMASRYNMAPGTPAAGASRAGA